MRGQAFWIDTSGNDMLFNDVLYGTCCKPASVPRDEQCIAIDLQRAADGKPF
jgi:hypothetical protein